MRLQIVFLFCLLFILVVPPSVSAQFVVDTAKKVNTYVIDSTKKTTHLINDSIGKINNLNQKQNYLLTVASLKDESLFKTFNNKKERDKELQTVLFACFDNAYLTASYDSLISDSLTLKAYLNFGIQYKWAHLKKGNVDEGVLSEIGFREKLYSDKPIYFKSVKRVQEKLLNYYRR
jgi:hypothetical protein